MSKTKIGTVKHGDVHYAVFLPEDIYQDKIYYHPELDWVAEVFFHCGFYYVVNSVEEVLHSKIFVGYVTMYPEIEYLEKLGWEFVGII